MTCDEARDGVYAYVACSMSMSDIWEFYGHLVECEECRIHVTRYRYVVYVLRRVRPIGCL